MPVEKTYFYVFLPDAATELAENVRQAFERFEKLYGDETMVGYVRAGNREFRRGLRQFQIKRVPAFAIADQQYDLAAASSINPYVSFDRPFLEDKATDEILNSVQDLHNICLTEDLLDLRRSLIIDSARRFFGKVWEELKDIVQIGITR